MASWKKIISEDTSGVASISSKLGVGTASPVFGLDVRSTGYFATASTSDQLRLGDTTNGKVSSIRSVNDTMSFKPDGSNTKFFIGNTGRIGLNTSSPNSSIHVNAADQYSLIRFTNTGASTGGQFGFTNDDAYVWNNEANGKVILGTNSTARMTITHDAKIGIGTDSPEEKLSIDNGSIQLENQKNLTWSDIGDGNTGRVRIYGNEDSDYIRLNVDNSNSKSIALTTTGVGMGTVLPSYNVDIQGSSSSGTIVQIRDTGDDYPVGIAFNHGVSGHHYGWYAGTMDGTSGERKFTIGTKVVDGFHNDLTTSLIV